MSKRKFSEQDWRRDPWFRALVGAFMSCKNDGDYEDLFRDVGTLSELQAWSERLECAKLLVRGFTQREVASKTGASTTTVNRVARSLENGKGYRRVLGREQFRYSGEAAKHIDSVEDIKKEKSGSMLRKYLQK